MGLPSIRRDDRVIWWFLKEKGKEGYVVLGVGDDIMMLHPKKMKNIEIQAQTNHHSLPHIRHSPPIYQLC
ncbi:hypothetical protein Bca4012_090576 [Brassica carinata]